MFGGDQEFLSQVFTEIERDSRNRLDYAVVEVLGEDSNGESSKSHDEDNVAEVTVIECGCKELNIVSKSF